MVVDLQFSSILLGEKLLLYIYLSILYLIKEDVGGSVFVIIGRVKGGRGGWPLSIVTSWMVSKFFCILVQRFGGVKVVIVFSSGIKRRRKLVFDL